MSTRKVVIHKAGLFAENINLRARRYALMADERDIVPFIDGSIVKAQVADIRGERVCLDDCEMVQVTLMPEEVRIFRWSEGIICVPDGKMLVHCEYEVRKGGGPATFKAWIEGKTVEDLCAERIALYRGLLSGQSVAASMVASLM